MHSYTVGKCFKEKNTDSMMIGWLSALSASRPVSGRQLRGQPDSGHLTAGLYQVPLSQQDRIKKLPAAQK